MYERFTDKARKAMRFAKEECRRFNHEYIGTEHILLGLVSLDTSVAAAVLNNLEVDLSKIRPAMETVIPVLPEPFAGKLPQTPRAKKVIEYAMEEARNLDHNHVGTEHLLLGLLREEDGVAAQVLTNLGLDVKSVRREVVNVLGQGGADKMRHDLEKILPRDRDSATAGRLPLTPRGKNVIEYAEEEARNLEHEYVGSEHLLLGLLREQEGVGAQVLMNLGLTLEEVRREVLNVVGQGGHLNSSAGDEAG